MIISDDSILGDRFKAALVENGMDTIFFSKPFLALNELKLSSQKYSLVLIDFTSQVKNSTRNFPKQVKEINDKIKIILISGFHFNEIIYFTARLRPIFEVTSHYVQTCESHKRDVSKTKSRSYIQLMNYTCAKFLMYLKNKN